MQKGFTLVEILVSVALFSVVMLVALGALLMLSTATRKATSINTALDNLSAGVESMSRTLRTGLNFNCGLASVSSNPVPVNCINGATSIAFYAADGSKVSYCLGVLSGSNYVCNSTGNILLRNISTAGVASGWIPLTTPEIKITNLKFYVEGACSAGGITGCTPDTIQPKITMLISGTYQVTTNQTSEFHLQSSVVQRIYDQ
jgi:prepilin-type N-terminal cleavage/methylation domain-containing protein